MIETSKTAQTFECRVASRDDETNVWDVLVEVAPNIPVPLDDPEAQGIVQNLIRRCIDAGNTWIAVDSNGVVVGFILAQPDVYERFQKENGAFHLPYVGVSKKWQKRGVFTSLLENLTSQGVSLTAKVLHSNKSNMTANLEKAGFAKDDKPDSKQSHLRWDPPDASQTN
jgi:ribosomal protein S18 acetylase RimI-like enzyme